MRRFSARTLTKLETRLAAPVPEYCLVFALFLVPVIIAITHGIGRPFHQEPDAGINWVYQTLLVTEGLHQTSYDHTGFLHFILMGGWYQLLDGLGIVSGSSLSQLQQTADMRSAFIDLIMAGRWFSGLFIGLLVVVFYFGLRSLTGYRSIAIAAAVLLAFCSGFVEQAIRIHTELFSAFFAYAALFLVIAAARRFGWRGLLWLALAAMCSILAMFAKLQVLPLLLALPAVALAFGVRTRNPLSDTVVRASDGTVLLTCLALGAFSVIALTMVVAQVVVLNPRPIVFSPRIVQSVFAAYFLLSTLIFAAIYRPHWKTMALGLFSLATGTSLGLYFLFIHHDPKVLGVLVNVVDHMTSYATVREGGEALRNLPPESSRLALFGGIVDSLWISIDRSFTFGADGKNLIITLYWALAAGLLWALAMRKWRLAVQLSVFLGVALGMETYCRIRYFAPWYYIYVEPWVLIGNALLVSSLLKDVCAARTGSSKQVAQALLAGTAVAALIATPFVLTDAFTDRIYRLEESHCGVAYDRAPQLPDLVCFETEAAKP